MMGMREKPRKIYKNTKAKAKEKIPRLVALPSKNGGQLFSGARKHRKQAGSTLGGRGILVSWDKEIQVWALNGQIIAGSVIFIHMNFQDLQQKRARVRVEVEN